MKWSKNVPPSDLNIEQKVFGKAKGLPQRIACQVYNDYALKQVVIPAARPRYMLSNVRKQWLKIIRQLQREHASTISQERKSALARELARVEAVQFVAKHPSQEPNAQVFFVEQIVA